MTKYSFEDNRNAVAKYINENKSAYEIMNETEINRNAIYKWVKQYSTNGVSELSIKHSRKNYNVEFKMRVVDYCLNSMEGHYNTAIKFKLNPSQVYQWIRLFKENGIRSLRPSLKGRPHKNELKEEKAKQIK